MRVHAGEHPLQEKVVNRVSFSESSSRKRTRSALLIKNPGIWWPEWEQFQWVMALHLNSTGLKKECEMRTWRQPVWATPVRRLTWRREVEWELLVDGRSEVLLCVSGWGERFRWDRLEPIQNLVECVYKKKRNVEDTGKKMSSQHSEAPEKAGGTTLMKKELVASFSQKERRKG